MDSQDKDRLWDEYKYRHQHIWNTVFKLTGAVVLVSIVPYTNREVVCVSNWFAVAPLAVAIGLALLGLARMTREVDILMEVRAEHRRQQGLVPAAASSFGRHVDRFLGLLLFATVVNAILVLYIWRPAVVRSADDQGGKCFAERSLTDLMTIRQSAAAYDKRGPQRAL